MRISFSLLFAIILSLDAFAAPVPTADVGNELALEVRKVKAAAKKVPKPIAKKVAPKPVAKKVAPKPVAKKVKPVAKKVAPKPVAKKVAAKPAAKKVAAEPVTKPAAKKAPVAAKKPTAVAKKPAAKPPVKAPAYKVVQNSFRVQKKPVAKAPAKKTGTVAKPPVSKKPVKAAPKPATAPKGAACPIRKKGSKAGVKARVDSDTECEGVSAADEVPSAADEGPSAAELCGLIIDCATCVGSGELKCAFDVKDSKCVPETTTGLTLATDKKTCVTLLAAAQQAAAPPAEDEHVTAAIAAAATAAFSTTVQDHIFKGNGNKKNSGRHLLSVWTRDNPNSAENKRTNTGERNQQSRLTGVVEFQVGGCKREIAEKVLKISQNGAGPNDIKTVWNDYVAADGTFVYEQKQIKELCLQGYKLSVRANTSNKATLKALPQPAASTSKKGKGKPKPTPALAALRILPGLVNGIVVHNRFINQNVCINISSESCFPLGIGTESGIEGSPCKGDGGVQD
ncbi:hypothetical protein DFH09DRAFT_1494608 [Mycena vulgaris]|nr:hypothetical protein DFH09DRAFT_1494608 [Mycena vulgaris]